MNTVDSLTHDGWGRVTAVTHRKNGGLLAAATYAFDPDGNITPNSESRVYDFATTRLTQRGSIAYKYDRVGNLDSVTSGLPAWKYIYDALDRLVEVRQNGTLIARYAYDVLDRRIVRRVYSGPDTGYVRMVYRGGEVIADADAAGNLTFGYTIGLESDQLLAIRRFSDSSNYYVVHDPLGSTRGLTRRDGTWLASWRYDAYGKVIDSSGSAPFSIRFRWTGREYDFESGLYFFRSRSYDPTTQRFVQEDAIGFAGGANLYTYGDGNPTNGRDPNGLSKSDLYYSWQSEHGRAFAWGQMTFIGRSNGPFIDWNGDGIDDFYYFAQVTWLSFRSGLSINQLEWLWATGEGTYTYTTGVGEQFIASVPQLHDVFVDQGVPFPTIGAIDPNVLQTIPPFKVQPSPTPLTATTTCMLHHFTAGECGTLESTLSGLGVGTLTALRCAKAGVFARRRYAAGGFYYTQRLEGMSIEGQDTFLGRDAFGGPMILQFALYLSEFVRMGDYTSDEAVDAAAGCLPLPSGQVS